MTDNRTAEEVFLSNQTTLLFTSLIEAVAVWSATCHATSKECGVAHSAEGESRVVCAALAMVSASATKGFVFTEDQFRWAFDNACATYSEYASTETSEKDDK